MKRFPAATARATVAAVFALGTASLASAADPGTRNTSSPDHAFIQKAAAGGLAEVALGKLAQQHASDGQVKSFGDRMAADHSRVNEELKEIAAAKGIALPDAPDKESRRQIDKLRAVSGTGFDRAYINFMVAEHRQDVAAFKKETRSGKDPEVKAFAAKTLPTLQQHLKYAQTTQADLVGAARSGGAAASAVR